MDPKTKHPKLRFFVKILSLVLVVSALTNVFFAGYFSGDSSIESLATYATKIVNKNTVNKKYCTITAQATTDSGALPDSLGEFHSLYGVFKQEKVTFASAMNMYNNQTGDKDHNIRIEQNIEQQSYLSNNLSFLYFGTIGTVEYNNHYKHYTYPIELMFEDDYERFSRGERKYVAYISQSHADSLLELYGETRDDKGKYSIAQYRSLLDDPTRYVVDFRFDDSIHKFAIMNIYFQTNYYYEGVTEALGEFVIASYYLPNNLRAEQKNIYYLSEYSYQNKYFMQYINKLYSNGKYKIEVNHQNIIGNIDDKLLTSFYYNYSTNNNGGVVTILVALSSLLLIAALFFALKMRFYNSLLYCCLMVLLGVVPYIVFRFIYLFTYSVSFFTYFSCKIYFVMLIALMFFLIITRVIVKTRLRIRHISKEDYYNVDI